MISTVVNGLILILNTAHLLAPSFITPLYADIADRFLFPALFDNVVLPVAI